MKTIPILKHPTQENVTSAKLIKVALENPPAQGFTTSAIRARLKMLDKLDALNEESTVLELDDNEFGILVQAVGEVRWAGLDRFIIDFEDSLK